MFYNEEREREKEKSIYLQQARDCFEVDMCNQVWRTCVDFFFFHSKFISILFSFSSTRYSHTRERERERMFAERK